MLAKAVVVMTIVMTVVIILMWIILVWDNSTGMADVLREVVVTVTKSALVLEQGGWSRGGGGVMAMVEVEGG